MAKKVHYIARANQEFSEDVYPDFKVRPKDVVIQKGDKVYVAFPEKGRPLLRRLTPRNGEQDALIIFRVTANQDTIGDERVIDCYRGLYVFCPTGALVKKAFYLIKSNRLEDKIDAIAEMKEIFLRNCAAVGYVNQEILKMWDKAMRLFTLASEKPQGDNNEHERLLAASKAFDAFCKLNKMIKEVKNAKS